MNAEIILIYYLRKESDKRKGGDPKQMENIKKNILTIKNYILDYIMCMSNSKLDKGWEQY